MSKPLWSRIRKQQCEHTSRQWIQTLESGILHEHSVVIPEVEINCWMPIQSYSISLQNLHLISSNIHITFCVEAVAVRPLGCRRCKHQLLRQGRRFFPFAYLVNLVVCFFYSTWFNLVSSADFTPSTASTLVFVESCSAACPRHRGSISDEDTQLRVGGLGWSWFPTCLAEFLELQMIRLAIFIFFNIFHSFRLPYGDLGAVWSGCWVGKQSKQSFALKEEDVGVNQCYAYGATCLTGL
jgi:hypothetical protein